MFLIVYQIQRTVHISSTTYLIEMGFGSKWLFTASGKLFLTSKRQVAPYKHNESTLCNAFILVIIKAKLEEGFGYLTWVMGHHKTHWANPFWHIIHYNSITISLLQIVHKLAKFAYWEESITHVAEQTIHSGLRNVAMEKLYQTPAMHITL